MVLSNVIVTIKPRPLRQTAVEIYPNPSQHWLTKESAIFWALSDNFPSLHRQRNWMATKHFKGYRGTQRGYSSKPLDIALLNVF